MNLKSYILAATVSLGVVSIASAQQATTTAPAATQTTTTTTDSGTGLLGSRYFGANYEYLAFDGSGPNHADGFGLAYNQPITANLDLGANYDWARARYSGYRLTQQNADLSLTGYTNLGWGKPYAFADAGWAWARGGGVSDDSFLYALGVGVEFPVVTSFVVSPYVDFARATGWNQNEWDFGVKAEYRVTKQVGIFAKIQYDAVSHTDDATEYVIGANYHF